MRLLHQPNPYNRQNSYHYVPCGQLVRVEKTWQIQHARRSCALVGAKERFGVGRHLRTRGLIWFVDSEGRKS